MTHLVIGLGEVGGSLLKYLQSKDIEVYGRDAKDADLPEKSFDVLHICYPYFGEAFVQATKDYIAKYHPRYVIVHSTVPVGVTRACDFKAVHSPIRGKHPQLEKSMGVFCKYFGGVLNGELKLWVETTFPRNFFTDKPETTEALKLWDTTQYGWMILLQKELYSWCQKHSVPFDVVYSHANQSYNEGYKEFGMDYVARPALKPIPGKIGGHCVIPNAELLDSFVAKEILKRNQEY